MLHHNRNLFSCYMCKACKESLEITALQSILQCILVLAVYYSVIVPQNNVTTLSDVCNLLLKVHGELS